jgi:hypothetical protein
MIETNWSFFFYLFIGVLAYVLYVTSIGNKTIVIMVFIRYVCGIISTLLYCHGGYTPI